MSTILLTGATGGLGRSVVKKLLEAEHQIVAIHQKTSSLKAEKNLEPYALDLTDEAGCQKLVSSVVEEKGSIDAAVLLAGGFAMGTLAETDYAAIEEMFRINFQTAYNLVKPVFAQMEQQKQGGRIVLISGRPALVPDAAKHMVAYALSKSLIIHLSEIINSAGKDKNIVSTVIVPSTIDTPANREAMPDADPDAWVSPDDLAELISFVTFGPGQLLREPVLKAYSRS
ncbi:SDR family NAD(P)-dependent oxidoreductase [Tellurirhabdus bombi]|uniref:SDR family NAD(P)-dependent oxidoreductase n=1 Tax=Tellurirhabdus bombi TaxID=2907205 RepID=UPI001F3AB423|nr:SDR family NAD(P)-dependent oxidoreductase [Tellurirhabdus bombi]